jgi:hypothetical protein
LPSATPAQAALHLTPGPHPKVRGQVADPDQGDRTGWAVLAGPEDNEVCVERSAAERAAGAGVSG